MNIFKNFHFEKTHILMSFNAILLKCVRLGVKGSFTLAYSAAKTHVTTGKAA
jgi:hypothetical protein